MLDEFGTKKENMSEEERVKIASYYVLNAKKLELLAFGGIMEKILITEFLTDRI